MAIFGSTFHASHFGPTRGGMGCVDSDASLAAFNSLNQPAPKAVMSVAVVHLSTGDIAVTTYIDGTFAVESVQVTVTDSNI